MSGPRLSLSEAADLLELKREDVLALVVDGELTKCERVGHRVLFDQDELRAYREKHPPTRRA